MKKNKSVREELERIYGKGCMFKKAKVEEKIESIKTIKTYKKFIEEKKYTGKIIQIYERQMNLHHLKHKFEGGETSVKNGVVINTLAHRYIHSLPREQEEFINDILREYKRQVDESNECEVITVDDLDVPFTIMPVEFYVDERGKYNRAKKKQEDKRLIDKYYEEER